MSKAPANTLKTKQGTSEKTAAMVTADVLSHLAFDNSLLANIITNVRGGRIIMANDAARKLLGYSKNEILTKSRSAIFDINESGFKKMLKQRTAEGRSIAMITALKKSGKPIPCEITSAIFLDADNVEKAITTITDMSQSIRDQKNIDREKEKKVSDNIIVAQEKSNAAIADNNEWIKYIAKASYDVMWDWDVATGQIYVGDSIQEVFGYTVQNNTVEFKDFLLCLLPLEKDIVEEKLLKALASGSKSWNDSYLLKRQDGSVASTICRASIVRNEEGKAIRLIGAIQDVSRVEELEKKIEEQILAQKMGAKNRKVIAGYTIQAEAKQRKLDIKNKKVVADNIVLAKTKQKAVDIKNKRVIAKNIVLAKTKQRGIDIENKRVVAGNIVLAKTKQRGIDIKNKRVVANNIVLAKTKQREIDTKKEKIVADNIVLAQAKSDIRLAESNDEHNEKLQLAAKVSFDGIWDLNLLTNEFFLGEGFEKLFGIDIKNKVAMADWSQFLHPDDKDAVEKGLHDAINSSATKWEHTYRFIKADGCVAKVFGRANIIRDEQGKAIRMIGVIHDLSRQKELEEKLEQQISAKKKLLSQYEEGFQLLFNSSSDVLFDSDLLTNKVIVSDAYEKLFGYKISANMTPEDDWVSHIHPDDKEAVMKDYELMLASADTDWKLSYRFLRADNSVAIVVSNRIILRDAAGKAYRMIGSMQDTSKQKKLEEGIAQEIRLKEKQIEDAARDAREAERSYIGKELHDNVNQLLGISKLYLDMAKQGGSNSEMYLGRSTQYTITAIEEIRKLTRGLTTDIIRTLGLCEAIDTIIRDTMEVNSVKIFCSMKSFKEESVSDKFKLNLFRIIQEQLNNILKHSKATKIAIRLLQNKKYILLTISDNGIGFDTAKPSKGIGLANIKSRASSYSGAADFISQPGRGCVLKVNFPFINALLA